MDGELITVEEKITEFWTSIFQSLLFFLNNNHQSLFVSVIHYIVFIFGFYYFLFHSKPKDIYRVIFFIFVVLGALSYFIFNKCFFTSIELKLCQDKNIIQKCMDNYFGEATEGNITSKIILSALAIITGLILLKDYGFLNKVSNRDA